MERFTAQDPRWRVRATVLRMFRILDVEMFNLELVGEIEVLLSNSNGSSGTSLNEEQLLALRLHSSSSTIEEFGYQNDPNATTAEAPIDSPRTFSEPLIGICARQAETGQLVAYAQVITSGDTRVIGIVTQDGIVDSDDLFASMVDRALDRVAKIGGGNVRLWVSKPSVDFDLLAIRRKMTIERDLWRMEIDLTDHHISQSSQTSVRTFVPGKDELIWLRGNNRAFSAHLDQGDWRLADLLARQAEPWFDPAGFFLSETGGELTASCWTKIHTDESPPIGEIYVIFVDPDFQGQGLGRALTEIGLSHFQAIGLKRAMLYVDSTNTAAVAMYESMGFTVQLTDRAYTIKLDPAT